MVVGRRAVISTKPLHVYRQHRPDIVLMDLRLPGRDGISAIEELRKNYPEVQDIVLSSEKQSGAIRFPGSSRWCHFVHKCWGTKLGCRSDLGLQLIWKQSI